MGVGLLDWGGRDGIPVGTEVGTDDGTVDGWPDGSPVESAASVIATNTQAIPTRSTSRQVIAFMLHMSVRRKRGGQGGVKWRFNTHMSLFKCHYSVYSSTYPLL